MKYLLILLAITATPALAQRNTNCDAATPNNAACIEWAIVATDTNGAALTGAKYRVERRLGTGGTWGTVATDLTIGKYYAQNLAAGEHYFRVFASCASTAAYQCVESASSNVASRSASVPVVQPNAPVIIIAATIRPGQPPTYRIVYTARPREGEIVFAVPEAMRSVYAAR
jgi:hypothetical protein